MTDEGPESAATLVSSDVRRHNLAVVARALAGGALSRSELATATGLTRGAVTALSAGLIDAGIARERSRAEATGRGRPHTRLELSAEHLALLALQLDADSATALLTTLSGQTLLRTSERHGRPMGDPGAVLDVLARVLASALTEADALGRRIADLTVVVFAPVGGDPRVLLADTDLGWGVVDVLGELRARVPQMPTATLEGDSTTAALAELRSLGSASDLLYIKSNSGIGGAIVAGRELVTGWHGFGGALGHIAVDFAGGVCACGQTGCLVTVAGPDVVLQHAGLGSRLAEDGLNVALAEFVDRVGVGDVMAVAAWSDACRWIARTLQILTSAFDPQLIVLGGYWSAPVLGVGIELEFAKLGPTIVAEAGIERARVVSGMLGDDAALLGAVWRGRDRVLADPLAAADRAAD